MGPHNTYSTYEWAPFHPTPLPWATEQDVVMAAHAPPLAQFHHPCQTHRQLVSWHAFAFPCVQPPNEYLQVLPILLWQLQSQQFSGAWQHPLGPSHAPSDAFIAPAIETSQSLCIVVPLIF